MIYVSLMGGLGNQMFQYACARKLSQRTGMDIKLDVSWFGSGRRRPELLGFCLPESVGTDDEGVSSAWDRSRSALLKAATKYAPERTFRRYAPKNRFYWLGERYLPLDPAPGKDIYLQGYWQSEKYFEGMEDVLRAELRPRTPQADPSRTAALASDAGSVCVHMRLGDYVGTDGQICTPEYYRSAAEYMRSRLSDPRFYVFSDSIGLAKELLGESGFTFVDDTSSALEDFELMRACRNHIMSNSTFSWWAQYLCDAPDRIAVAPSRWHTSKDFSDIYRPGWVLMDPSGRAE